MGLRKDLNQDNLTPKLSEVDAVTLSNSTETSELVFEPVVNESHVDVQPKGSRGNIAMPETDGNSQREEESAQTVLKFLTGIRSSHKHPFFKSLRKEKSPREEEQVFLDDLARLQRQEKEANEEAEALIRNHEQDTEKAVTQAEAAKTSSTNVISTVSTTSKASGLRFKRLDPSRFALWKEAFVKVGIDYDEVFAPVARLEAIRIFLAYASYMGFIVYQMDVKSAFLYGKIEEEVKCSNHRGFPRS
ncbi:putative ribonuclease H-like domain-containing protein [Tanacetum coccineum]